MESQAYASVSAGQLGLALRLRQEPTQPRCSPVTAAFDAPALARKTGAGSPRLSQSEDARLRRTSLALLLRQYPAHPRRSPAMAACDAAALARKMGAVSPDKSSCSMEFSGLRFGLR